MGIGAGLSWVVLGTMGLLWLVLYAAGELRPLSAWHWRLAWAGSILIWVDVFWTGCLVKEPSVGLMGLLGGAALALPASGRRSTLSHWRILAMTWALLGGWSWLAYTYFQNYRVLFHVGLVVNIALLVGCHLLFRPPLAWAQVLNTLILLLAVLPLVDPWIRPKYRFDEHPDPRKKEYLYSVAQKDPGGYAAWVRYAGAQWRHMTFHFFIRQNSGPLPFVVRTNCQGPFFNSTVAINSLGFRGREISRDKGNAYRIVALGESTTFGITMNPEDKPWPDTLEQLIRNELHPSRPVEVINAGLPGYTLDHNLYRLKHEILPLKPDLIVSYHGINGFPWICPALAPPFSEDAPIYNERPLKLLADFEFSLRVAHYKIRQKIELYHRPPYLLDPMKTEFARAYRELIAVCQTNGIRLALANYSMAINNRSDPRVAQFYQQAFPVMYLDVKANEVHSGIVRQLTTEHPDVCFVDTHPGLDGDNDKFTDMVHMTEEGRQQLALNIFESIRGLLQRDLASTASVARP